MPILEAQGLSSFKRKLVNSLTVTQNVEQTGQTLAVKFVTSFQKRDLTWIADGEVRPEQQPDGREFQVKHVLSDEALVTTSTGLTLDGAPFTLVTTRRLEEEGKVTKLHLEMEKGEDRITLDRRLRRNP